jgi:hypothetical protein
MLYIVVSDCGKAHVSSQTDHNVCADLLVLHDHTFAESLQVDNPCSVIHYHFYALIWLIYMILSTHISNTMHVNKFCHIEMNTHDITVSAIRQTKP